MRLMPWTSWLLAIALVVNPLAAVCCGSGHGVTAQPDPSAPAAGPDRSPAAEPDTPTRHACCMPAGAERGDASTGSISPLAAPGDAPAIHHQAGDACECGARRVAAAAPLPMPPSSLPLNPGGGDAVVVSIQTALALPHITPAAGPVSPVPVTPPPRSLRALRILLRV